MTKTTILTGHKDPNSDLRIIPLPHDQETLWTTQQAVDNEIDSRINPPRPGPGIGHAPKRPKPSPEIASFSYHRSTKENAVKFMHQSLGNPPIRSLLKAIDAGFLHGAPHLTTKSVRRYLMPSPATSKGHMKRPRKGLRSTTSKPPHRVIHSEESTPEHSTIPAAPEPDTTITPGPVLINNIDDESIANVFCFGAFADKNMGVVYNDCTGSFPFMSLDGNVCFS